jgi:hypothetical protein
MLLASALLPSVHPAALAPWIPKPGMKRKESPGRATAPSRKNAKRNDNAPRLPTLIIATLLTNYSFSTPYTIFFLKAIPKTVFYATP